MRNSGNGSITADVARHAAERLDIDAAGLDAMDRRLLEIIVGDYDGGPFVYFSTEYGWHESLQIYSGGLGVLSGDHLKEASDLGLPMVAVGLLYAQGYFSQRITEDGWQETREYQLDVDSSPICPVMTEDGKKPLSDSRLADILGEQGIVVARRTVAKYRELLGIPPVNLRKVF